MFPVRFVAGNAGNVNDSSLVLSLGSSWEGNSSHSLSKTQRQKNIPFIYLFIVYSAQNLKYYSQYKYFDDGSLANYGLGLLLS